MIYGYYDNKKISKYPDSVKTFDPLKNIFVCF